MQKTTQYLFLIENLRKYRTLAELHRSSFYADCKEEIERILVTSEIRFLPGVSPVLSSFLRVAQWNIEKGKRFNSILDRLQNDEILRRADIIVLNEADRGMNRSGNRHVAWDLARNLGMNMVFGPAYLELTKGIEEELLLEGENQDSIQGNAILSRYPVKEACVLQLPAVFEPYEFQEKRYGRRNCLWARIEMKNCVCWVGSVHLELRNTPKHRAEQIKFLLKNLPGKNGDIYILAGDLNTNSFSRGSGWRTLQSMMRLLFKSPERMKEQLLHPERGFEPLFEMLKEHGFHWDGFNSNEETGRVPMGSLEEAGNLPDWLVRISEKRLKQYNGYLGFRLDWLFGKGVRALGKGERKDSRACVSSLDPACIKGDNYSPSRASDHLPIYADFDLT